MRESIQEWIKTALKEDEVKGKHILEVGSMDVNGSVRPYLESLKPKGYWGIDMRDGLGVDQVQNCEDITPMNIGGYYDIVVCCEMLEHAEHWQTCLSRMFGVMQGWGILILTTVMPGFPKHDFPNDYHRFTEDMLNTTLVYYAHRWKFDYDDELGIFVKAYKT